MLQQENRLKRKRDIEIVFENGRFVPGRFVNIKVWHVTPPQFPKRDYSEHDLKFAFVVGKKIDKRAVKRNRYKRQMREVVRLLLKEGSVRAGNMVVVMAKPTITDADFAALQNDITATLQKVRVLK